MFFSRIRVLLLLVTLAAFAPLARAVDYQGVQPFSLDQPQVNALVQPGAGGNPYFLDLFGFKTFNIPVFLDTGSSGVVISKFTADLWEIPREPGVQFNDVAIGGTTAFEVSPPVRLRIAPSSAEDVDNLSTFETVYNQAYGPMRVQIGPTAQGDLPLDVFGMPVMMGKNVVIDPKPGNSGFTFQQTYIYEPGTPFNPATADTNPGIPTTERQVKLSYGDFARFTSVTPDGAQGPQLNHNPFIGPNPLLKLDDSPPPDDTPPVRIGFEGKQAEGSFLFDTGAAASFISLELAAQLGVRYGPSLPNGDPTLETFDLGDPDAPGTQIANQFGVDIQGIGGQSTLAGFFLDSLLLQTLQGSANPDDPNNIRYLGAPVLVADIELIDPITGDKLFLDGIFGMNFLMVSATLDLQEVTASPYDWIVFDEPNGLLGFDLAFVPEPGTIVLAAGGLLVLAGHGWRRRVARRRRA